MSTNNAVPMTDGMTSDQLAEMIAQMQPKTTSAQPKAKPTDVELMMAEIARLKGENEKLKASKSAGVIRMQVSEKGALSVYGLGRFPVTLYRGQWERLLAAADAILAFIKANEKTLAVKGEN